MKRTIFFRNKFLATASLAFAFFMLTFGLVSSASAVSPDIVNLGVGTKGKYVVVNARLVDGFTEAFYQQIMLRWEKLLSTHLDNRNLPNKELV